MSGTCGTHGKKINARRYVAGGTQKELALGSYMPRRKTVLKCILEKQDGKARTETISGVLWPYSNEEIGPENSGNVSPT